MANKPGVYQSGKLSTVTNSPVLSDLRKEAHFTGQIKPLLENQYGIFLWDLKKGKVLSKTGLNPANGAALPEYFFSMAPKVYEMTDPFASQIVATQAGGKFVESHGSIIKPIRISGTTGIRPRRSSGSLAEIPLIGSALSQLDAELDVLLVRDFRPRAGDKVGKNPPPSEQTGFDDIIFMRNIFRQYSDFRENAQPSNHIVMVWYNAKEGDSWIVEPKEFKLTRNASSPLTYDYNIVFQTLAPLETALGDLIEDPLDKVLAARKIFSRVQEYNTSLKRTFLIVSTQVRRLEGLGVFAQTELLDPIINVTRGLGVIRATAATFGSKLRHNALVLSSNLDNAIDLLTGTPGVEAQDALVRTLRRTSITAARILAEPGVRETVASDTNTRQERYSNSYTTGGDSVIRARVAPDTGGSSTFIGNNTATDRVGQDFVNGGEDIRSIAGRLLGDKGAWHILAAMNGLSSPYIAADGRPGTLGVGDTILYPSADAGVFASAINPVNTDDSQSAGKDENTLGPAQQAYGRDIRLVSNSAGSGVDLADLKVSQRGDVSTIVGIPNVEQSLIIKFSTERGELPAHPGYGGSFPIGKKATSRSINEFRVQTVATIKSDARIEGIQQLSFVTVQDVLVVNATLILINATDSLSTAVSLRSV